MSGNESLPAHGLARVITTGPRVWEVGGAHGPDPVGEGHVRWRVQRKGRGVPQTMPLGRHQVARRMVLHIKHGKW